MAVGVWVKRLGEKGEWSLDEVMLPGLPDVGRLFCF